MNKRQQRIIWWAIIMIALMLLFPPFRFDITRQFVSSGINMGYAFLLDPPRTEGRERTLVVDARTLPAITTSEASTDRDLFVEFGLAPENSTTRSADAFSDNKAPKDRSAPQTTPPTWDEVTKKPEFKSLPLFDRERMREKYWQEVVLPRVPLSQADAARMAFDADTRPWWEPFVRRWTPSVSERAAVVNIGLLLVQWLGVILIAGALWWLARDKE